jgi:hypothetical protein
MGAEQSRSKADLVKCTFVCTQNHRPGSIQVHATGYDSPCGLPSTAVVQVNKDEKLGPAIVAIEHFLVDEVSAAARKRKLDHYKMGKEKDPPPIALPTQAKVEDWVFLKNHSDDVLVSKVSTLCLHPGSGRSGADPPVIGSCVDSSRATRRPSQ